MFNNFQSAPKFLIRVQNHHNRIKKKKKEHQNYTKTRAPKTLNAFRHPGPIPCIPLLKIPRKPKSLPPVPNTPQPTTLLRNCSTISINSSSGFKISATESVP